LPDQRKETLEAWFDERGAAWCAQVEVCCADMWDAYHEAAQAKLPNVRRVVDRFHIMKNLNDALSKAVAAFKIRLMRRPRPCSKVADGGWERAEKT
jgi:transposase